MRNPQISTTQESLLARLLLGTGKVDRLTGGVWCAQEADGTGYGGRYFGTRTIATMVEQGVLQYTEWNEDGHPTIAELVRK